MERRRYLEEAFKEDGREGYIPAGGTLEMVVTVSSWPSTYRVNIFLLTKTQNKRMVVP